MSATAQPTTSLEALVRAQAFGLGFDLAGIATLGPVGTADAFDRWLAKGFAGEMDYLPRRAAERRDSRLPVPVRESERAGPHGHLTPLAASWAFEFRNSARGLETCAR